MKMFLFGSVLVAGLILSGCESACCQNVTISDTKKDLLGNLLPIPVITGLPTEAKCGTLLNASALQSEDKDGVIVSYDWTLDGTPIGSTSETQPVLPCNEETHTICLKVTDDQNASQQTCQSLKVNNEKEPEPIVDTCKIEPVITYEKADSLQYKFFCEDSTYNGTKIDLATTTCEWTATKKFIGSDEEDVHSAIEPVKWINVDPATFESMDLTLTVKNGDCQKSITKHYILADDLPY